MTKEEIKNRLNEKTIINEITGCWLHQGAKNNAGHVQIEIFRKSYYIHRLSAYIYLDYDLNLYGIDNLQVNHKLECPNKNCWNPEHIYIGTQQENVQDTFKNGRKPSYGNTGHFRKYCPNGHEYTPENTYEKLLLNGIIRRECKICQLEKQRQRRAQAKIIYQTNKQQNKGITQ